MNALVPSARVAATLPACLPLPGRTLRVAYDLSRPMTLLNRDAVEDLLRAGVGLSYIRPAGMAGGYRIGDAIYHGCTLPLPGLGRVPVYEGPMADADLRIGRDLYVALVNQIIEQERTAMPDTMIPASTNLPIARIEGEARILDTDLAARLGFAEPRMIRKLIARHAEALTQMGRCDTVEHRPERGGKVENRYYLNRKQAIFITAKSETPTATDITIEIIERFDAYERGERQPPAATAPTIDLNNKTHLRSLAVQLIAANEEKDAQIAELTPKAAALDRIATASGSYAITDAAKELQMPPGKLFSWLRANKWIYKRLGCSEDIAYQDKIQAGYLEHKNAIIPRSDGTEKIVSRARVTPKGLAKLAQVVPGAALPLVPAAE